MAIHDRYARRTPYERFLPDPEFPERRFPAIEREAEARGLGTGDPGAFAMLEATAEALEEVRRPDEGHGTLAQHAAVLFHAYHHHRAGRPVVLVREEAVRRALEGAAPPPPDREAGAGPFPDAVYVQLPQHLVWVRAEADATPQPLDGFFWTRPGDGSGHLLAVAGLLEERPGFTVVQVPGVPLADADAWAGASIREGDGADFATDLPGAEIDGLLEIRLAGELLKLVARLEGLLLGGRAGLAAGGDPGSDESRPRPSTLSYQTLD